MQAIDYADSSNGVLVSMNKTIQVWTGLAACVALSVPVAIAADFNFLSSTLYSGPTMPGFGMGLSAHDIDHDGDVDLFVPTPQGTPNQVFINQGDGTFVEAASSLGLADTRAARTGLWLDYDGDGDIDLLVARDCFERVCDSLTPILSLHEQDAGLFTEVTADVGLFVPTSSLNTDNNHVGGISAADLNDDGLPDIYLAIWQNTPLLFYSGDFSATRGDDPGGYLNAGLLTGISTDDAGHWQGLFHDFDGDLRMDLFVNVDFEANQLWMNQPGDAFSNSAVAAGVDSVWNEMGVAAGDYDADGDIDLYVTNIHGWINQPRTNLLYRNDTLDDLVQFTEVAIEMGVEDSGWGWGTTWLDADNDGDLDLAATNGYCQPVYCQDPYRQDASRLFLNPGDGSAFIDASTDSGFDDTDIGSALLKADFNNDGLIDLLQSVVTSTDAHQIRLLLNSASHSHDYLRIRLQGPNLAGTVLTLSDGQRTQAHLVTYGTSFLSQEPVEVHFGLGHSTAMHGLTVTWPDGGRSVWGRTRLQGSAQTPMTITRNHLISEGFE